MDKNILLHCIQNSCFPYIYSFTSKFEWLLQEQVQHLTSQHPRKTGPLPSSDQVWVRKGALCCLPELNSSIEGLL